MPVEPDPEFEQLLEFVRDTRGFDYTLYKRPSLMRRFQKRMEAVGATSFEGYRTYLGADAAEFRELFNTILINVTAFFRDEEAWRYLGAEVIPQILEHRADASPIRIWSAGCASGEEPFTAAILFCEALGDDEFRDRVKIYATDADENALSEARQSVFTAKQLEAVPEELIGRYFRPSNGAFTIRSDVRRVVIFGRNDLLQDPPISRVDLLVSRNTLMYFEPPAQDRVLANFAFALNPRGFLMVGKAEALQSRTKLFDPVHPKNRVFMKRPLPDGDRIPAPRPRHPAERRDGGTAALKERSFEQSTPALLILDASDNVVAMNQALRATFGLKPQDAGRSVQELELAHPALQLRPLIEEARRDCRPITRRDVEWGHPGEDVRRVDVQVTPLTEGASRDYAGALVSFADISRFGVLTDELTRARHELETTYEELHATVEELETTNEELQSTNEELETTNEELQSSNEELETINEELQSTNEELEAMNDELRERTDETLEANAFLSTVLWSIEHAIVVVDDELRVSTWSRAARELWGLTEDEVAGDYFLNLDIGIPLGELLEPIRRVLAGDQQDPVVVEGHDRRGRPLRCEIKLSQLCTHLGDVKGVILVMEARRFDGKLARRNESA
jgi:two-component system, chemotaxis family, CheB/CheR fusion protein